VEVEHGDFHLTAADGNRLMAHFAYAADPRGVGIVIVPAMRGLGEFYKDLARRFAQLGYDAVAIDYYGRTAGDGPRDETFDFPTHYDLVREDDARIGTDRDVLAGVDHLRSLSRGGVGSVFTLGFCYGGSVSWRQSALIGGLSGAIGFYGAPQYVEEQIASMSAPLLVLVAGDDAFISAEENAAYLDRLRAANVTFRSQVYEGAPHSFFDRRFADNRDACEDAWQQLLGFIETYTA
jgi:carboxymethylenebutenolidase